jgi:hypothetical protein
MSKMDPLISVYISFDLPLLQSGGVYELVCILKC